MQCLRRRGASLVQKQPTATRGRPWYCRQWSRPWSCSWRPAWWPSSSADYTGVASINSRADLPPSTSDMCVHPASKPSVPTAPPARKLTMFLRHPPSNLHQPRRPTNSHQDRQLIHHTTLYRDSLCFMTPSQSFIIRQGDIFVLSACVLAVERLSWSLADGK